MWEQEKLNFRNAGSPPWASERELGAARVSLEAWGLGSPVYYEHRAWGWMARFVDSKFDNFQMNAHTAVYYTHLVIANYQVKLLQEGIRPAMSHPLVGIGVWQENAGTAEK